MLNPERNQSVYNSYKPFRNHLKKLNLILSLQAIYYHTTFQQFSKEIPPFVEVPIGYRNSKKIEDLLNFGLLPWELEVLIREVIINSPRYGSSKSLNSWNQMTLSINKLKALEEKINDIYTTEDNVLIELHRIAHRQFHWEHRVNTADMSIYFMLYSNKNLSQIIESEIGISLEKIYLIALALTGSFLNKFVLWYPPHININGIAIEDLNKFLEHFSNTYEYLRVKLKEETQMNEKYSYGYHSLIAYPLIQIEYENKQALICPIITLLLKRITEGIYYEINSSKYFDNYFGDSFQEYIGNLLKFTNKKSLLLSEKTYGSSHHIKRTVDWIFGDNSGLLFIECKTKKITFGAKANLINTDELKTQLGILADALVQVYKQILKYKSGEYPHIKYIDKLPIYPIVVTLEEWFLFGNRVISMLDELVKVKLIENDIDIKIVADSPYTICSVNSLNMLATINKSIPINEIMRGRIVNKDKQLWHFETYLSSTYPKEITNMKIYGEEEFSQFTTRITDNII